MLCAILKSRFMKIIFLSFLISITLFSCNNNESKKQFIQKKHTSKNDEFINREAIKQHIDIHKQMDLTNAEESKFCVVLNNMYKQSVHHPQRMILKADNLIKENEQEKNPIKLPIQNRIASKLNYFKAETLYKMGKYDESIKVLSDEEFKTGNIASALAANYIKLGKNDKAKLFIDAIGNESIHYYILGNYYESIGNKEEALKIYYYIKQNLLHKPYVYYQLCIQRIDDIKQNNHLLKQTYFPPGNPYFKECKDDYEVEKKIYDTIFSLPEVRSKPHSVLIYQCPLTSDSNHHWVIAKCIGSNHVHKSDLNFFVYLKPFTVKYFDKKNNRQYSLNEWRKNKNGI
jgi:tetratricopeptide (TPR) repeat protein